MLFEFLLAINRRSKVNSASPVEIRPRISCYLLWSLPHYAHMTLACIWGILMRWCLCEPMGLWHVDVWTHGFKTCYGFLCKPMGLWWFVCEPMGLSYDGFVGETFLWYTAANFSDRRIPLTASKPHYLSDSVGFLIVVLDLQLMGNRTVSSDDRMTGPSAASDYKKKSTTWAKNKHQRQTDKTTSQKWRWFQIGPLWNFLWKVQGKYTH